MSCFTGNVVFDRLIDPSYYARRAVVESAPTFAVRQHDCITAKLEALVRPTGARSSIFGLDYVHWVPSDMIFDLDNTAHVQSYVYGVPPSAQSAFIGPLETMLTSLAPLFEHVFSGLASDEPKAQFFTDIGEVIESPIPTPTAQHTCSLRGRAMQVVVELARITVPVGAVDTSGDSWHEAFCRQARNCGDETGFVSALDFLQISGLAPPQLSFWYSGATERDSLGLITGYPGRCIVFPSLLRHSFQPLRLTNPQQPGSMLVLQIRMLYPDVSLISTATVVPQQQDAIVDCTLGFVTRPRSLPVEIHSIIAFMLGWDGLTRTQLAALQSSAGVKQRHPQ